jgi:hypothetical protein
MKVKFGETEYDIKPLRIIKAREWRQKMMSKMQEIGAEMSKEAAGERQLMQGLGYILLQFPTVVADLVFEYAPDLPEDKVLEDATEEQMAIAFGKIMQVAFPFQGELRTIMQVMALPANSRT